MRVIAGTYRSRPLQAPKGMSTRPTSDRLRETLFNVLADRVPGCRFADLYAGSGAVGIEAISRGAADVVFSEKSPAALAAIRGNLRTLKVPGGYSVDGAGVAALLKKGIGQPFDVVYLDPPYDDAEEYRKTLDALGSPGSELLHEQSVVIAEHTKKQPLLDRYGGLARYRSLVQGDAVLSFYRVEAEVPLDTLGG
jgi:16S rRNA (guanine966-N2)-methyltransferase